MRALIVSLLLLAGPTLAQPPCIRPRVAPGEPLAHHGTIGHAAFSPDGRYLAATEYSSEVSLWDLRERCVVSRFHRPELLAVELQFTPDGRHLLVLGEVNPHRPVAQRAIQVIDPFTGVLEFELGDPAQRYEMMAISPSGHWLTSVAHGPDMDHISVHVFDLIEGQTHARSPRDRDNLYIRGLRFADDATISTLFPGQFYTFTIEGAVQRREDIALPDNLGNFAFGPDGVTMVSYIERAEGSAVNIHDLRAGTVRHHLDTFTRRGVHGISFSPDGSLVAIATTLMALASFDAYVVYPRHVRPRVEIFDVATGQRVRMIERHGAARPCLPTRQSQAIRVVFTQDARTFALFGSDRHVCIMSMP